MTTARPDWFAAAVSTLRSAGVPSPEHDAAALVEHVTAVPRWQVRGLADPGPRFWALLQRRAAREPLQHLVGVAWFRTLTLQVGPGVFVPRPETEMLAEAAIGAARTALASTGRARVVDLGTGSGAIALSVAVEVPGVAVHAVEQDDAALRWACRNVAATALPPGSRVTVHHGDLEAADALLADWVGDVDVVVSNPPYIPPDAIPRDPEVRDHDPAMALYGAGADGLGHLWAVVAVATRLLRPGGVLAVEHADVQGDAVRAMVRPAERDNAGWVDVTGHDDLAGRPRYVTARWTGAPQ